MPAEDWFEEPWWQHFQQVVPSVRSISHVNETPETTYKTHRLDCQADIAHGVADLQPSRLRLIHDELGYGGDVDSASFGAGGGFITAVFSLPALPAVEVAGFSIFICLLVE
ncbi:hypothetical protein JTB14_034235 [Gonioctena quinquepunctata]|nr:hypothetical protein JTB14_034235 [Gonioctena quinquepunctata]